MNIRRIIMLAVSVVLMAWTSAWGDVAINAANFPNDVFRAYVSSDCDTDHDGILSDAEIASKTMISLFDYSATASIKGIKYFTALTWLDCDRNQLAALDMTNNNLSSLSCNNQYITLSGDISSISGWPYILNLNTAKSSLGLSIDIIDFTSHVLSLDIRYLSGDIVTYSPDIANGMIYFASRPEIITYRYDTGASNIPTNEADMSVAVTEEFPIFTLYPSSISA